MLLIYVSYLSLVESCFIGNRITYSFLYSSSDDNICEHKYDCIGDRINRCRKCLLQHICYIFSHGNWAFGHLPSTKTSRTTV